jgi:hypothetical protein
MMSVFYDLSNTETYDIVWQLFAYAAQHHRAAAEAVCCHCFVAKVHEPAAQRCAYDSAFWQLTGVCSALDSTGVCTCSALERW